jgi:hypothetical protein
MIVYDDLEPFKVGAVFRFGQPPIVCYDLNKVLAHYVAEGMTEEEAIEFFEFNVIGAWVGDTTPCFLDMNPDWDQLAEDDT